MKNKIEVDKVLQTIDATIAELKAGFDPTILSDKAKTEISTDLARVIRLALKIKLQGQQEQIKNLIVALETEEAIDLDNLQEFSTALDAMLSNIKKAA